MMCDFTLKRYTPLPKPAYYYTNNEWPNKETIAQWLAGDHTKLMNLRPTKIFTYNKDTRYFGMELSNSWSKKNQSGQKEWILPADKSIRKVKIIYRDDDDNYMVGLQFFDKNEAVEPFLRIHQQESNNTKEIELAQDERIIGYNC